jgi:hypothetical protein
MTKKSPETMHAVLAAIEENPNVLKACTRAGISNATFWSWISQSQRGNHDFVLPEYLGSENVAFHDAFAMARKMAIATAVLAMEERAMHGHTEISMYKGAPVYKIDPAKEFESDEVLTLLYGTTDRYLRDENGDKVPYTIHHAPPIALSLAVSGAHFPQLYGNKTTIEHVSNNLGSKRIPNSKPLVPSAAQPLTPNEVEQKRIEISNRPAGLPASGFADDEEIDEGEYSDVASEDETENEIENPEPAPRPSPPAPQPRAAMSELERDLLARLKAGPTNPRPNAMPNTGYAGPRAGDPPEGGAA